MGDVVWINSYLGTHSAVVLRICVNYHLHSVTYAFILQSSAMYVKPNDSSHSSSCENKIHVFKSAKPTLQPFKCKPNLNRSRFSQHFPDSRTRNMYMRGQLC